MGTTIDILRHGEPVGGRRYRGQLDDPLSEKGWAQMRAAVGGHCPWRLVATSPLRRCAAFAEELAAAHGLPLRAEPRLQEVGFGAWEGRTREELSAAQPGLLERFYADPVANPPPGAEPLAAFQRRVVAVWRELLVQHQGSHVLIVAHAGVIRMLVAQALGLELKAVFRLQVPNASITRLEVEDPQAPARVLFHGVGPVWGPGAWDRAARARTQGSQSNT